MGSPGESHFGFPHMHRFSDSAVSATILPSIDRCDVAFTFSGQGRHTEVRPSSRRLGRAQWLACVSSRTDAQHDVVTFIAPPPESEVDG
jgi:hypothetical protein